MEYTRGKFRKKRILGRQVKGRLVGRIEMKGSRKKDEENTQSNKGHE